MKTYVDGSLNTINTTLSNKQNTITVSTPLIKDVSNNITIDLSAYPLKTYVDGSLNTINTNKQNKFTCISPLIKNDISNNISIDLSGYPLKTYVDGSLNTINTILSNKQNTITVSMPLIKDVSNNITIDLSAYPLKTYVDGSLNTINTTLLGKENTLSFTSPLTRNVNTIGIDLSGYLLKSGGTITNDLIINNGYTLNERQYPPKSYNISSTQTSTTFLGQGAFVETITLNTTGIDYGSGDYVLYSSTSYSDTSFTKHDLFDYTTADINNHGHWVASQYSNGIYITARNKYINSNYLGDWLVVKLPNPIILTRYRFYPRPPQATPYIIRCPAEFKFYGSMDGITFNEITEAHQLTRLGATDYSTSGYYEKVLSASFNTPYLYIGFTVNKLVGTATSDNVLNFGEFQIFGKEPNTAFLGIGKTNPSVELDISGNITALGRIKSNNLVINEGNIDTSGNSLVCYCNNPGVYFTDNSFNSFFNFSSAVNANGGLQIQPFITVYNRMFKNTANTALKFSTYGGSNSGVNS